MLFLIINNLLYHAKINHTICENTKQPAFYTCAPDFNVNNLSTNQTSRQKPLHNQTLCRVFGGFLRRRRGGTGILIQHRAVHLPHFLHHRAHHAFKLVHKVGRGVFSV